MNLLVGDLHPRRRPEALVRALHSLGATPSLPQVPAVVRLLSHHEPDVRVAALGVLFVEWKDSTHRSLAIDLLEHDANDEVRAAAAYAVAGTTTEETQRGDTRLFVSALEADASSEVQRAAYEGLLIMFRRPDFPDALADFDSEKAVDWAWIEEVKLLYSDPGGPED